jgi:hypothetical protein
MIVRSISRDVTDNMSFGFSVGNINAVWKLIADISSCLKDVGGAKTEYQGPSFGSWTAYNRRSTTLIDFTGIAPLMQTLSDAREWWRGYGRELSVEMEHAAYFLVYGLVICGYLAEILALHIARQNPPYLLSGLPGATPTICLP